MKVLFENKRPIKIWTENVEAEALQQLKNMANMPFIFKHVAVMPDVHAGKGSTVGTVIATSGAIIPAAVGVDIGCGMCAVKLPIAIEGFENLPALRSAIETAVPVGFNQHQTIKPATEKALKDLMTKHGRLPGQNGPAFPGGVTSDSKMLAQLGTLGGGNHFVEICQDTEGGSWIVLHSGSRNLGKTLADYHINEADGLMKKYFIDLPDPDLAYLAQGTPEFKAYIDDLLFAQDYAAANRRLMMDAVIEQVFRHVFNGPAPYDWIYYLGMAQMDGMERIDCHHNYTSQENHFGKNVWITRKGAVSARPGQLGIIPGSMGTKSYIVEGLGNPESFCSCSHGAGRIMSRTKAKATFTKDDLAAQTEGVECRKDADVIDEIPGAYKPIDEVMENQKDLVKPIFELKQILCVKG